MTARPRTTHRPLHITAAGATLTQSSTESPYKKATKADGEAGGAELVWALRHSGHTIPDPDTLKPGQIVRCRTAGHSDFQIAGIEESDPGPYHGYGDLYMVVDRVSRFDRYTQRRIQEGDYL